MLNCLADAGHELHYLPKHACVQRSQATPADGGAENARIEAQREMQFLTAPPLQAIGVISI
jgi:hypothetical protein